MALVRLVVFGFLVLSVVYLSIAFYSRSVRREKLEEEWDAIPSADASAEERGAFIKTGLMEYHNGFWAKLIWLVYIIPTCLVAGIVYFTNY